MFVGGVASGVVLGFIYLGCGGFGFSSIAVSPSFLPSSLSPTLWVKRRIYELE
jgi:hypothetical protein